MIGMWKVDSDSLLRKLICINLGTPVTKKIAFSGKREKPTSTPLQRCSRVLEPSFLYGVDCFLQLFHGESAFQAVVINQNRSIVLALNEHSFGEALIFLVISL